MTHLILTTEGIPYLAVWKVEGWLTNSGIINNENIKSICPVGEIEKRITRICHGDKIYNTYYNIIGFVDNNRILYPFSITTKKETHSYNFVSEEFIVGEQYPRIIHYAEAERRGLVNSNIPNVMFNNSKITR